MCQRRLKELEDCLFYWGGYNQEATYRTGGNLWQPMHLIEDRIYEKLKKQHQENEQFNQDTDSQLKQNVPQRNLQIFKKCSILLVVREMQIKLL